MPKIPANCETFTTNSNPTTNPTMASVVAVPAVKAIMATVVEVITGDAKSLQRIITVV